MTASKKTNPLSQWAALLTSPRRTPTAIAMLLALAVVVVALVWNHVKEHVRDSGRYTVTLEQINVTPLPAWIHTDVRADVFRNASLDAPRSTLDDDDLADRIARAFSLHPWVAKVVRVAPATWRLDDRPRIDVELVYRRPVCMVESRGELLPVDVEGVLLPSGDFSPNEKLAYPCLWGIETSPLAPVGQRWGDGRVVEGAEIAAALAAAWQPLRLFRIQPAPRIVPAAAVENSYTLFTRAGTRIFWGLAPSTKAIDEPSAAEKVARLLQYVAERGTLEGRDGPQQLDVRNLPAAKGSAGK